MGYRISITLIERSDLKDTCVGLGLSMTHDGGTFSARHGGDGKRREHNVMLA